MTLSKADTGEPHNLNHPSHCRSTSGSPATPALQPHRLRPPVPAPERERTDLRLDPPLAQARLGLNPDDSPTPWPPTPASPAATSTSCTALFVQIERVLRINDLSLITSDVVEAARRTLVIGDTQPPQANANYRSRSHHVQRTAHICAVDLGNRHVTRDLAKRRSGPSGRSTSKEPERPRPRTHVLSTGCGERGSVSRLPRRPLGLPLGVPGLLERRAPTLLLRGRVRGVGRGR